MEEVFRVELNEIDRDYLQFLTFEKKAYSDVLGYILLEKQKGYDYSIENYTHFMNEYKETNIKYELVFAKFIKQYAPQYFGNNEYNAYFDLENCQLIISKNCFNCNK